MTSRIARLIAIAVCLVAPLGWSSLTHAATTAEVTVSGQVVDVSISFTLSANSVAFGDIDKTGDVYDSVTSTAEPFFIEAGNAAGAPVGTYWFIRQPLLMSVTSSVFLGLYACLDAQSNVTDASGSRMFVSSVGLPPQPNLAQYFLSQHGAPDCAAGPPMQISGLGALNQVLDISPVYAVFPGDDTGAFSATIRLSISPL